MCVFVCVFFFFLTLLDSSNNIVPTVTVRFAVRTFLEKGITNMTSSICICIGLEKLVKPLNQYFVSEVIEEFSMLIHLPLVMLSSLQEISVMTVHAVQ